MPAGSIASPALLSRFLVRLAFGSAAVEVRLARRAPANRNARLHREHTPSEPTYSFRYPPVGGRTTAVCSALSPDPSCHVCGFRDLRRAFATVNAPRLKPEVLQRLMRRTSHQTTQKHYINPTSQIQDAVSGTAVPAP